MESLNELGHLGDTSRLGILLHQADRPFTWEKNFNRVNSAQHKFLLHELLVSCPGHGPLLWELCRKSTEEVAAILEHVLLMTLEEIVNQIQSLW